MIKLLLFFFEYSQHFSINWERGSAPPQQNDKLPKISQLNDSNYKKESLLQSPNLSSKI
jgi:hypothetical protein